MVNNNNINTFQMISKDSGFLSCSEIFSESIIESSKPPANVMEEKYPRNLVVTAEVDQVLLEDERILQNLMREEEMLELENPDYLRLIQVEVKPHMRKIVSDWMLEVCQEMGCPPPVFCLAVRLMDRFLANTRIVKNQLQLLGATCLFLASKFKETAPIPGDRLVMYTDFSITIEELREWEMLVLSKLQWDLSSHTAIDFLDNILPRLPFPSPVDLARFRCQVETIISLCSTYYVFTYIKPSILAASAIATATRTVSKHFDQKTAKVFLNKLQSLTRTDTQDLEQCSNAIIQVLPAYLTTNLENQEKKVTGHFSNHSLMVKTC